MRVVHHAACHHLCRAHEAFATSAEPEAIPSGPPSWHTRFSLELVGKGAICCTAVRSYCLGLLVQFRAHCAEFCVPIQVRPPCTANFWILAYSGARHWEFNELSVLCAPELSALCACSGARYVFLCDFHDLCTLGATMMQHPGVVHFGVLCQVSMPQLVPGPACTPQITCWNVQRL